MPPTLDQTGTVPHHHFSLHSEGTPIDGRSPTCCEQEQLPLSPALDWANKGAGLRVLLNRAIIANQITLAEVERNTDVDEKQAARSLKEGGGAHPPLALVAYLLWNDRQAVILSGIAARLGYEVRKKEPDLAAENRQLKSQLAALRAVLAGEVLP